MFKRFLRSVVVLAAIIAAYQAYVLFAVPLMEPLIQVRPSSASASVGDLPPGSEKPETKYQLLLSNYFPKDHWSQVRPPKVFASSSEMAMLVLDDYKRHEEAQTTNERYTQVDIARFALLIFPTPPREGVSPPRDAIILEAPQGARLKFEEFRPELGRIGQITGGQFPGEIHIHSDMREPGLQDDLDIVTSDMQMNTKLLFSTSPVQFRMGENVGGGRELEISFLADEHVQPKGRGLKIAGIDTLEIRREVRMRMQLETESLLPGGEARDQKKEVVAAAPGQPPATAATSEAAKKPPAPVEVTCSGPFTFDFVRYVAAMDRDVALQQLNTNGPVDQMFCNKLEVHFAPKPILSATPQPVIVDPGKRQQRDLGRLEPVAVVASGHPVIVNSPLRNARAQGDQIQIGLKQQRVRISGPDATLVYGTNVVQAPLIDYQHPSRGSGTPIGSFSATGPGAMQFVPDVAKPEQIFRANWQSSVNLNREQGQLVLALDGRPQFAFGNTGSLAADGMKIYLRELQGTATAGMGFLVSNGDGSKIEVAPDRIIASGHVDIQSPRITGRTNQLFVAFRMLPPAPAAGAASNAAPGQPQQPSLADRLTGGGAPSNGPQQTFHIDADRMQLEVAARGKKASPTTLACEGNIVLREVPLPGAKEQPLEITGAKLTVDRMDTTPYITLRGATTPADLSAPVNGNPPAAGTQFAKISGHGVTMQVVLLELDVHENHMWSNGSGHATLLVTRDLQGNATPTQIPLELSWQGGMNFDGSTIAFDREAVVAGTDDTLQCDRILATLNKKILFGGAVDQNAIDVREIECVGRVMMNHLTRDTAGVTSHERMELARLAINQQTGAISGDGPGVIRSTRFGDGLAALAGPQNPAAPQLASPPPGAAGGSKLHFLRVDFDRGLTGNMITRELTLHERVRAVYGPVDSWEQELDAGRPETLPKDAMTLSCDDLRLNEDPAASRTTQTAPNAAKPPIGAVQATATGNVRIDGQTPKSGAFSAQADSATYDRAKDAFILEGQGRTPARLWRAGQTGPPFAARWIRFVPSANNGNGNLEINQLQNFEITPQDVKSAQRPGAVR